MKDSRDCIPSVKIMGTWREFIGICSEIDIKYNIIRFALMVIIYSESMTKDFTKLVMNYYIMEL